MLMTVKEILNQAKGLTPFELAQLIDQLYGLYEHNKTAENYLKAHIAEVESRIDAYERGEIDTVDYEEIKKSL